MNTGDTLLKPSSLVIKPAIKPPTSNNTVLPKRISWKVLPQETFDLELLLARYIPTTNPGTSIMVKSAVE